MDDEVPMDTTEKDVAKETTKTEESESKSEGKPQKVGIEIRNSPVKINTTVQCFTCVYVS